MFLGHSDRQPEVLSAESGIGIWAQEISHPEHQGCLAVGRDCVEPAHQWAPYPWCAW